MTTISADVQIPSRSRTFSQEDATRVLNLLQGRQPVTDDDGAPVLDDDGNPTFEEVAPVKNVGYGEFGTAGAARSAAVTLNRLLTEQGAPHKYAATTFERDGKVVGVLLNKAAKARKDEDAAPADAPAEDAPPADPPKPRRRRNTSR